MGVKIWTAEDIAAEDAEALDSLNFDQRRAVDRDKAAWCMALYTEAGYEMRLARMHDAEANRRNAAGSVEAFDP